MTGTAIAPKPPLVDRPVFLDGISRGGKFLLGKIVSSLEDVEYFQAVSVLEHIPILHRMGAMSASGARTLLQMYVDEHAYGMRIGRGVNLRHDDASSVHNAPRMSLYLERALGPLVAADAIKTSRALSTFLVHECLPHARLFFSAFPDLRWISIVRDPLDVAHSWHKRGWGHRFLSDPLSFVPMVDAGAEIVPWYFREFNESYQALSPMDRIIRSLWMLGELGEREYGELAARDRARVMFVPYEALVEETDGELVRLEQFLERPRTPQMPITLARERCPRPLPGPGRSTKLAEIKSLASPAGFELMLELSNAYVAKYPRASVTGAER